LLVPEPDVAADAGIAAAVVVVVEEAVVVVVVSLAFDLKILGNQLQQSAHSKHN
jgi:hypothetical protein